MSCDPAGLAFRRAAGSECCRGAGLSAEPRCPLALQSLGLWALLISPSSGPATQTRSNQGPQSAGQPYRSEKGPPRTAIGSQLRPFGLKCSKKETLPHSEGKRKAPKALEGPEAGDAEDVQPPPRPQSRTGRSPGDSRAAELSQTAGLSARSIWEVGHWFQDSGRGPFNPAPATQNGSEACQPPVRIPTPSWVV